MTDIDRSLPPRRAPDGSTDPVSLTAAPPAKPRPAKKPTKKDGPSAEVVAVWEAEDGRCEACTRAMDRTCARVATPRRWLEHWRPPSRPRPRGSSRVSAPTACCSAWTVATATTGCPESAPSRCSSPLPAHPSSAARSASSGHIRRSASSPRPARAACHACRSRTGRDRLEQEQGGVCMPWPSTTARTAVADEEVRCSSQSRRIVRGHDESRQLRVTRP